MTRSMTKRMKQILQGLIMEVKGSSTHYIRGYSKVDHFSTSWWRFEPNMKTTWQKSKFTRQSIHGLKLISFMVWIIIEDSFSYFVGLWKHSHGLWVMSLNFEDSSMQQKHNEWHKLILDKRLFCLKFVLIMFITFFSTGVIILILE